MNSTAPPINWKWVGAWLGTWLILAGMAEVEVTTELAKTFAITIAIAASFSYLLPQSGSTTSPISGKLGGQIA